MHIDCHLEGFVCVCACICVHIFFCQDGRCFKGHWQNNRMEGVLFEADCAGRLSSFPSLSVHLIRSNGSCPCLALQWKRLRFNEMTNKQRTTLDQLEFYKTTSGTHRWVAFLESRHPINLGLWDLSVQLSQLVFIPNPLLMIGRYPAGSVGPSSPPMMSCKTLFLARFSEFPLKVLRCGNQWARLSEMQFDRLSCPLFIWIFKRLCEHECQKMKCIDG